MVYNGLFFVFTVVQLCRNDWSSVEIVGRVRTVTSSPAVAACTIPQTPFTEKRKSIRRKSVLVVGRDVLTKSVIMCFVQVTSWEQTLCTTPWPWWRECTFWTRRCIRNSLFSPVCSGTELSLPYGPGSSTNTKNAFKKRSPRKSQDRVGTNNSAGPSFNPTGWRRRAIFPEWFRS